MQSFNMIMIDYWDKKLKKRLHVLEVDIIMIKKKHLMSLVQMMHFLHDLFQMTIVSVMNYNHINGLHLFWDTR